MIVAHSELSGVDNLLSATNSAYIFAPGLYFNITSAAANTTSYTVSSASG